MRPHHAFLVSLSLAFAIATTTFAQEAPEGPDLPASLSLADALNIFRARGLDVLIADAAVKTAEGAVTIAGAVQNPVVSGSVGNSLTWVQTYASGKDCSNYGALCNPWTYNVGINDAAAFTDWLSGKRELRLKAARNALAAAKMSRTDAARTLTLQVKTAYLQVAQAQLQYAFARDVGGTETTTLRKFQDRFRKGAINEGDLQRIEVEKLEADQAVDAARSALQQARTALGFLLGVRGDTPSFDVDPKVLDYAEVAELKDATAGSLIRPALDQRPDLVSAAYQRASADAQLELVKRQKIPGVTLGVNYQWGGFNGWSVDNSVASPLISFNVSAPIPLFYQLQGEQRQAEAQRAANALQHAKATAQVVSDVTSGLAALESSRSLVQRMEGVRREGGGLLQSAKGAFDVAAAQYERGSASLTDYLDALRTYIATKNEYIGDLTNYWTAVYQLEAAVGRDLR